MSELISGKDALIALANDRDVDYLDENLNEWVCMDMAHHFKRKFRLKPRTITLNGIEVPAPFEPKKGDMYYRVNPTCLKGDYYKTHSFSDDPFDHSCAEFGVWRTEEEIRQVVAALRKVFGGAQ
jgi:hypothetical protein